MSSVNCMPLLVVIVGLLSITSLVNSLTITVDCVANGDDCHKLKQLSDGTPECDLGTVEKTASVTIKYCYPETTSFALDFDPTETYTLFKGAAIKNANNGMKIYRNGNTAMPFVNGCYQDTFDIQVDTCANHFNVNAYGKVAGEITTDHEFQTFMKRNCDLEATVTCTLPNGQDCTTMTTCDPLGPTTVKYEFCFGTFYTDQTITIRENYLPDTDPSKLPENCPDAACKESHAYIGRNYDANKFFNNFPSAQNIGMGSVQVSCFIKNHNINTCASLKIPNGYINVVGEVTATSKLITEPVSDFKACFSADKFQEWPLAASGSDSASPSVSLEPSSPPSLEPSNRPSFAPSAKPSAAPTMKPTITSAPSANPTSLPSVSHAPSISHEPSISHAPSISFAPTVSSAPVPNSGKGTKGSKNKSKRNRKLRDAILR